MYKSPMSVAIQAYAGLSLKEFLIEVLKPYPDIEDALKLLTDEQSPEYYAFHLKATLEHVHLFQIRQKGITYQLNRKSSIRNTQAYEQYIYAVNENNPLWENEVSVACRFFRARWDKWFTIKLK